VETTKLSKEAQQFVSSKNQKPSFIPSTKPVNPTPPSTPLKIQKLTRAEIVEHQLKVLCYNCYEKYFPRLKCKEQNIFMAMSEDVSEEDVESPLVSESPKPTDITRPSNPPEVELVISLNDLTGFSAPQTLKLIGYIKHMKVIILVDSGNTHNFIHCYISQKTNCYIRASNNFQIMIANGGSMKCGGRCEKVCLQIGDYHKFHMFAIDMGGFDIVLGAGWRRNLGPILMDFKEITMQFEEGQKYKFQGITASSPDIISYHRMEKMLKECHSGIFPNSMPYKQLIHPLCRMTSNPSSLNIKCFFPPPGDSLLSMVFMIIQFPLSQESFLPISIPIVTLFPKKMKLRKWFNNCLTQVLSSLVRTPTLLLWSCS